MRLLIIGAPGAGKGTQSVKICEYFKIPHLSTGDIFRDNIKRKTEIGKKVEDLISHGNLVPDELTMKVVEEKLRQPECSKGFLMDGFPRNEVQAQFLDKILEKDNQKIDYVINLVVKDEIIVKRMMGRRICTNCGASYHVERVPPKKKGICDKCGNKLIQREDDSPEIVEQRLEIFHTRTEPIVNYYRKKGLLVVIDGKDKVEDTTIEILRSLGVLNASY